MLTGRVEHIYDGMQLDRDVAGTFSDRVRGSERPVAGPYLRLRLMRERPVDELEEPVVLPEAEAERDPDHHERRDQSRAQLVQMTDGT